MSKQFSINGQVIADDSDCYVIAEIGHNHQGDLEKAKELFRQAKESGVDAVKLQKRDNRTLFTRAMFDKPYDNENSFGATYGEHREALEFGREEYVELLKYAREIDVTFFATAFDMPSADFLADLDMPAYKLASGDLKNTPLLKYVAALKKPMIISTGGASFEDIDRALEAITPINENVAMLQCTATYPTDAEDMNLLVISEMRRRYPNHVIGLSDHFNGIAMSLAAYMLGARIIEKHFTLNRSWKGTDHALSLEPVGMRKLVRDLRRARAALGAPTKRVLDKEVSAITKMGKALFAARALPAGHVLSAEDITIRSPGGGGLPPYELDRVIGMTLSKPLQEEEVLTMDVLSGDRTDASGKRDRDAKQVAAR